MERTRRAVDDRGPAACLAEFIGNFLLAYVAGPLLGALAAGLVFFYLLMAPGAKGTQGMEPVG